MNFDRCTNKKKLRNNTGTEKASAFKNLFEVDDRIIKGIVTTFLRLPFLFLVSRFLQIKNFGKYNSG